MTQEKLGRRPGQQRADRECHVGGAPDLADGGRQQAGQTLPSIVGRKGQAVPAALGEPPVGVDEAVRHAHGAILENARIRCTPDFKEGVASFLEKRKPVWQGK